MINVNWNDVQDEMEFPVPGGYAAKIIKVEDNIDKEYLMISWDFADGKFKGSNQQCFEANGYYPYRSVWSYKTKALGFFKRRKKAVEETNKGFIFQNDPQSLVGKFMGVILGEEEYWSTKDNKKKTRLYVADIVSGQKIRSGDFLVPELKKMEEAPIPVVPQTTYNNFETIEDDDAELPF